MTGAPVFAIMSLMRSTRTYTFTGKLSPRVHRNLDAFLSQQRVLWNAALEERISAWEKAGKNISRFDQFRSLSEIRQDSEFSQYHITCQRTVLKRLDGAFKSFFVRVKRGDKPGFPRFRGQNRPIRSFETDTFTVKQSGKFYTVNIKGIGKIRFKADETVTDMPRLLRVVKTPLRVKVQFVCDREIEDRTDTRPPVGIDLGVKSRVALSSGEISPGVKNGTEKVKRLQRKLSRAKRGSNNRRKIKTALSKEHQRIKERAQGAVHELTAELVKRHSARFFVEDLQIGNMVKNRKLARSIHEQQWGSLVHVLSYKAVEAGGWVERVNPAFTSQACAQCGALPDIPIGLKVRMYACKSCGRECDRDVNAAKNILSVGLRSHGRVGQSRRDRRMKAS